LIVAPVLAAVSALAGAQAPAQSPPGEPSTSAAKGSAPATTTAKPAAKPVAPTPKSTAPAQPVKKVDLNNASLDELKTLPTVGDAEAKKIIEHRPYKSKGELVTKAGLPEGVYHAVKRKVELQTPRKAAPKK